MENLSPIINDFGRSGGREGGGGRAQRSGLMVNAPARVVRVPVMAGVIICVAFFCKILNYHNASLHPEHKWVLANLMLGGN